MKSIWYIIGYYIARCKYEFGEGYKKGFAEPPIGKTVSSGVVETAVLIELRAGQYVNAIKKYRELSGTGLKEAKDEVDRIKALFGIK